MKVQKMFPITVIAIFAALLFADAILSEESRAINPLRGWTTVVISPYADISIVDGETSSTDKEALVDSLIKVLADHGVLARKATSDDERRIKLSIRVMRGRSASFLLRIQHQEPAEFERDGDSVSCLATTWEAEEVSEFAELSSTQRPILEKAMEPLARKLAEATGHTTKTNQAELGVELKGLQP